MSYLDEHYIRYIWNNIKERCGSNNPKYNSYKHCKICDEWLDFNNFYKWYIDNYYEIPNEKMCVDKDVLFKNNNIYSPNTCCILPNCINVLLTKRKQNRGNLPIGVYKKNNKFCSKCKYLNKTYWLGTYDNEYDAFLSYKNFKEQSIKDIANKYKGYLPNNIYIALLNYNVEIND